VSAGVFLAAIFPGGILAATLFFSKNYGDQPHATELDDPKLNFSE